MDMAPLTNLLTIAYRQVSVMWMCWALGINRQQVSFKYPTMCTLACLSLWNLNMTALFCSSVQFQQDVMAV